MSPDKQRIAIAGAIYGDNCSVKLVVNPQPEHCRWGDKLLLTPDYLNDLNAMHEAEKVLTPTPDELEFNDGKYIEYCGELCRVCGWLKYEQTMFAWDVIRATAAQRAEAFLRTIGKWEEAKP